MATVHQCDLCGKINQSIFTGGEKFCGNCNRRLNDISLDIRQKVLKVLGEEFQFVNYNHVQVVALMKWLQTEKRQVFMECFGLVGEDLLNKATQR